MDPKMMRLLLLIVLMGVGFAGASRLATDLWMGEMADLHDRALQGEIGPADLVAPKPRRAGVTPWLGAAVLVLGGGGLGGMAWLFYRARRAEQEALQARRDAPVGEQGLHAPPAATPAVPQAPTVPPEWPPASCPGCGQPLELAQLGAAWVQTCPACLGTLVESRGLTPMLVELSRGLQDTLDLNAPIGPATHQPGPVACPRCNEAMEPFGYMETQLVRAWRCNAEAVLWADAETVGVMAVLFARTELARQDRQGWYSAEQEDLNRRVNLMLRARMRASLGSAALSVLG